jgi:hypothetical protein
VPDVFFRGGCEAADEFRDGSTDGLREIAILEQSVCHKSGGASAKRRRSAAELIDDPENQAEKDADDDAGDQREVEGGALAAMDDVAGQAAEAKGKFGPEIEEGADNDEKGAEDEQGASELLSGLHGPIVAPVPLEMAGRWQGREAGIPGHFVYKIGNRRTLSPLFSWGRGWKDARNSFYFENVWQTKDLRVHFPEVWQIKELQT